MRKQRILRRVVVLLVLLVAAVGFLWRYSDIADTRRDDKMLRVVMLGSQNETLKYGQAQTYFPWAVMGNVCDVLVRWRNGLLEYPLATAIEPNEDAMRWAIRLRADLIPAVLAVASMVWKAGPQTGDFPVCSGPWQVSLFDGINGAELTRNPYAWQSVVHFDRIVIRPLADASARVNALLSGAADYAFDIPVSCVRMLEGQPKYRVLRSGIIGANVFYFSMNTAAYTRRFPAQLSGGELQRITLAHALG